MFTGIVQATGTVASIEPSSDGARLDIRCAELEPAAWSEGDSVAVAGCCLTALDPSAQGFRADLSQETLDCTSLGRLQAGDPVNLEPALAVGDRLGGHLVTGHVDGLAELVSLTPLGENTRMEFAAPEPLTRFIARKGSVTLDGVSLTVNAVDGVAFEVNLIPHTLAVTTLGRLEPGHAVNLEIDLLARYTERLLSIRDDSGSKSSA